MRKAAYAAVVAILALAASEAAAAAETVAVQLNPAHTGVTDERIGPPLKLRWKRQFLHPERGYEFEIKGTLAAGGRIFAVATNESSVGNPPPPSHFYALDPKNGETLWTSDVPHFVNGIGYGGGRVLVAGSTSTGGSSGVEAFDPATGSRAWVRTDWPGQTSSVPRVERFVVAGDRAFATVSGSGHTLYALEVASGAVLWQQSLLAGDGTAVDADRVYVNESRRLSAFGRSDGAVAWQTETPTDSDFSGDPVVTGGRLLVAGHPGAGAVYDAGTGEVLRYPAPLTRYPAADSDRAYTSSPDLAHWEGAITEAVPLAPGAKGWEFGSFTGTQTHPVVVGDVVYVAGSPRGLYALDKADGSIEWCSPALTGGTWLPLAVGEGLLLVPQTHTLLAFEPGGRPGCRFYATALSSYTKPIEGYRTVARGHAASVADADGFIARRTASGRLLGFVTEGPQSRLSVSPSGLLLELGDDRLFGPRARVALHVRGARRAQGIHGERRLAGVVNVYSGRDPSRWRTGAQRFDRVRLEGIRRRVDMVVREPTVNGFEYDFELAPGADPSAVAVQFVGAGRPVLDRRGNLHLSVLGDAIVQAKPVAYQRVNGQRVLVPARFRLRRGGLVGFALGRYDRTRELVIDPTLEWSTYLGGGVEDQATAIASDPAGNIHVAGWTNSRDLPGLNPFDGWDESNAACSDTSPPCTDAIVAKYSRAGRLVQMTYISGEHDEVPRAIAADSAGNTYVTGHTMSQRRFPIKNAFQGDWRCGLQYGDAFVTKLAADGSLVYSSYLGGCGGSAGDYGQGITADDGGRAIVAGFTDSSEFPTTEGAADRVCDVSVTRCYDGFVARVSADGAQLEWSTLSDGPVNDVELDSQGRPVVVGIVGHAERSNEPFAARLGADGSTYEWMTTWGGTYYESAEGLALDSADDLHVVGATESRDFPTTKGALDRSCGRASSDYLDPLECYAPDGFASEIAADGSRVLSSTYVGGAETEYGFDVAVDRRGRAYMVGGTGSRGFPRRNPYRTCASWECSGDAFVLRLNSGKTAIDYGTLHGGLGHEEATGVTLAAGDAWIAGEAGSPDIATTRGAPQRRWSGGNCGDFSAQWCWDAFVARLDERPPKLLRVPRKVRGLSRTKTGIIAGRVVSAKAVCRRSVLVVVQLRRNGRWLRIADIRSRRSGRFAQGLGEVRGRLRVRVPRVLRPSSGRVRVCQTAASKPVS